MITQKIAEIIEKNAQCVATGSEIPGMLKYVNAVPVNTLIRELCKVLKVYSLFDPAEFTQTALGIKEREYLVTYPAVVTGYKRVRARSEKDAIAKVQLKHPHRINPSITAEEVK